MARRTYWLDMGIPYLGKPTGSSWQLGWGAGSQEEPRKLQEQPKSTEAWPGGAPGWIWASLAIMAKSALARSKGSERRVLPL